MIPLTIGVWLIAAILMARYTAERATKSETILPCLTTDGQAEVHIEIMDHPCQTWKIPHPFMTEVMVQLISPNPRMSVSVLAGADSITRHKGYIIVEFTREVSGYAAVIVGKPIIEADKPHRLHG
jgi:hypothetical protein